MSTGVKMAQKKITGPPAHQASNFLNFGKKKCSQSCSETCLNMSRGVEMAQKNLPVHLLYIEQDQFTFLKV